jgi:inosine-uridine nucleoside N-ribohydrolase
LPSLFFILLLAAPSAAVSQASTQTQIRAKTEKVILDTDIGDDIDDVFALALALRSPELEIIQINSDFGDTAARTRILDRFLAAVGRSDIAVATGVQTTMPGSHFSQRRYGEKGVPAEAGQHPDAVTATLNQIRRYPGEITLIAIGPLFNVGERWPGLFEQISLILRWRFRLG